MKLHTALSIKVVIKFVASRCLFLPTFLPTLISLLHRLVVFITNSIEHKCTDLPLQKTDVPFSVCSGHTFSVPRLGSRSTVP